jgi:hypothetical protein
LRINCIQPGCPGLQGKALENLPGAEVKEDCGINIADEFKINK